MAKLKYEDSGGELQEVDIQSLEISTDYEADMYHPQSLAYTENEYDYKHDIMDFNEGLLELVKQLDARVAELEKRLAQQLPRTKANTDAQKNAKGRTQ